MGFDAAYITSVFLLLVQVQTDKRSFEVCRLGGNFQGVLPLNMSLELFGLKAFLKGSTKIWKNFKLKALSEA